MPAERVLLVDDEPSIIQLARMYLEREGFDVEEARDGEAALVQVERRAPDLMVLDVMLPKVNGFEVCKRLRAAGRQLPILMLTARDEDIDKILGLELGADDYLTKPFALAELLARLQALIRRATKTAEPTSLVVGDLVVDLVARRVERAGRAIELRPREFALLEYLMRNAGRVVSKTMILAHVWDYHFDPRTNVVDVLVFRLREKVDRDFEPKMLHTVRGVGYVLKVA